MYFTGAQFMPYINSMERWNNADQRFTMAAALEGAGTPIPGYPTGFAEWQKTTASIYYSSKRPPKPEAPEFTLEQATFVVEKIEEQIRSRNVNNDNFRYLSPTLYKWIRPWDVVPELKTFKVPKNDYGVGIEVEMGFRSVKDAQFFCDFMKDWKHVTFDFEGGDVPIETTFPPMIYSEMNSRSLPFRYLRHLEKNKERVHPHFHESGVGTHLNVSKGGVTNYNPDNRLHLLNNRLQELINNSYDLALKYFGRRPYGLAFNQGKWVEFKLFNSVTDQKRLRQYIDIAVSLIALVLDEDKKPITAQNVHIALEEGFCKSLREKGKKNAPVESPDPKPEIGEPVVDLTIADFAIAA
jgi:hypothetical protein